MPEAGVPTNCSACSRKCSGFGTVTFSQLFLCREFYKRKPLVTKLPKALMKPDEVIEHSPAVYRVDRIRLNDDRDPPSVIAVKIYPGRRDCTENVVSTQIFPGDRYRLALDICRL